MAKPGNFRMISCQKRQMLQWLIDSTRQQKHNQRQLADDFGPLHAPPARRHSWCFVNCSVSVVQSSGFRQTWLRHDSCHPSMLALEGGGSCGKVAGATGNQLLGNLAGYPLLSSKERCKRTGRRDLGGNLKSCW